MSLAPAKEGSKLYSYLLNRVHNLDPQQQHNLLPHHSKANCSNIKIMQYSYEKISKDIGVQKRLLNKVLHSISLTY